MKNTKYISASAGSGKTYSIVNEIAGQIQNGIVRNGRTIKVRGDQVIATTFTNSEWNRQKWKDHKGAW